MILHMKTSLMHAELKLCAGGILFIFFLSKRESSRISSSENNISIRLTFKKAFRAFSQLRFNGKMWAITKWHLWPGGPGLYRKKAGLKDHRQKASQVNSVSYSLCFCPCIHVSALTFHNNELPTIIASLLIFCV